MCDPEEDGGMGFSALVAALMEPCAREVMRENARQLREGFRPLPTSGLQRGADGSVAIPLPGDCLAVTALETDVWKSPLEKIYARGDPRRRLQESAVEGVRGSASRPAAFEEAGADGRLWLRIYGCEDAAPDGIRGRYVAAPAADGEGAIEIPADIAGEWLRRIARAVQNRESFLT